MAHLPDFLYRGAAIFILALGIGMIAARASLAAVTASRSGAGGRRSVPDAAAIGAYLTVWFAAAIVFGDPANFPLTREELRLPLSLLLAFGPVVLGVGLLFASSSLRRLNAATPAQWIIWTQTYRVAGLMFLFPFLYYGIVPAGFAIPAAAGDFITGALAPVVGRAVAGQRPNAIRWATAWNLFGVVDLIVAPAAALLAHAQLLDLYPLSLVALFIGPPLGILTHVYSLRNLAAQSTLAAAAPRRASRASGAPVSMDAAPHTT